MYKERTRSQRKHLTLGIRSMVTWWRGVSSARLPPSECLVECPKRAELMLIQLITPQSSRRVPDSRHESMAGSSSPLACLTRLLTKQHTIIMSDVSKHHHLPPSFPSLRFPTTRVDSTSHSFIVIPKSSCQSLLPAFSPSNSSAELAIT